VERAYEDYRTMLDREQPQFVVIAPRWVDGHAAMILDCAARGIHMFCEKPLARDLAECDAIVAACERAHVKLAVAFQTRYGPRSGDGANRRFGLNVYGARGVVELRTGWLPADFLLADPSWTGAATRARWAPITSAGPDRPEPLPAGDMVAANRLIVADLVHAV